MNRYTIRDYDKYLDMESGMYPYQDALWKCNKLDESRGIVDDYLPIVDELYNALLDENPVPFNNEIAYFQYVILDHRFKREDLFMESCDIVVFTGAEGNSSFFGREAKIMNDSKRMVGCKFTIRIENKFLESESGKNEFYEIMAHELQHAYRFYNIFLSNNSYNDEEKEKMKRNINAYEIQQNPSSRLEHDISIIYYISERNEISSEANKLYEYIRNHKEINDMNIEEHFNNNLPLYTTKVNLENFLEMMDSNLKEDDIAYVNSIGKIFKRILKDEKTTPSRAFIKFRTRILDSSMFADRLFKRTLAKAFEDFDRKVKIPNATNIAIEMVETNKDFELLKEILNRH